MVELLPKAMNSIGAKVQGIFTGVVNTVKGALRNVLQFIANGVNFVGNNVNKLIASFNRLPGARVPYVPILNIPAFARGGYHKGGLRMVGENGPEVEATGPARIWNARQTANMLRASGGMAGGMASSSAGGSVTIGAPVVNITTGPVMQAEGQTWVTLADLERSNMQTAEQVFAMLKTPAGRRAVGIA